MKKQWIAIFLCLSLLATGLLGLTGCAAKVQADDLMKGITPEKTSGRAADDAFKNGAADFAVRLFQNTREEGKSSLISPLSVMLALSMTANGARGETLAQMEVLLGGGIPIDTLNKYLHAYVGGLPSVEKAKLTLANSIWFKDSGFTVEEAFLQRNADYYGAAVYKSAFDKKTLRDINNWVKENTDGVIDKIVDQMDPYAVMYLVNTVLFDNESLYLDDGKATGFLKPYKNGYSFAALLPNEGVALDDYIASLTGEGFLTTVKNAKEGPVEAAMPKFSYDYGIEMSDALKALGMTVPFDAELAVFSGLGHSSDGNIYISCVLHKAYIAVDEKGTKAGAATAIEAPAAGVWEDRRRVILDRPFVYAIIDNAAGLPIFIGAVTDIQK